MKATEEFFVSQCIRWNERLRNATCELAGIQRYTDDPAYTLAEFRGADNLSALAARLQCEPEGVFARLKVELGDVLGIKTSRPILRIVQRPSELGPEDLQLFLRDEFLAQLSAWLGCSPEWPSVFNALIESTAFIELVTASGIAHPEEDTAPSQLFFRMISSHGLQALGKHFGGPVDAWDIIDSLTTEEARRVFEHQLGCSPRDAFSHVATPAESRWTEGVRVPVELKQLDTITIAKMRELLRAIGGTHLRDAQETVGELAKQISSPGPHLRLRAALEYFALRHFRAGLLSALVRDITIGNLLSQRSEPISNPSDAKSYLLQARLHGEGKPELKILYKPFDSETWQLLVTLYFENLQQAQHVARHIPSSAERLEASNSPLYERLLRYKIPVLLTKAQDVWLKWSEADDSIVNYFILAGHTPPDDYDIRQKLGLEGRPKEAMVAPGRTECATPQAILEAVLKRFEQNGTEPKIA